MNGISWPVSARAVSPCGIDAEQRNEENNGVNGDTPASLTAPGPPSLVAEKASATPASIDVSVT